MSETTTGEDAPRPDFEAIEIAPGLFRDVPKVDAYLVLEARAQAATALYEALREIVAKVALKLPMYAIEYDKARKAIADYEKAVKG